MAQVETGDVLRLGATMLFDSGFEIANVFHCEVLGGADKSYWEITDDVDEYISQIYDELTARIAAAVEPEAINVANVTQELVFGRIPWTGWSGGSAGGEATPLGVCCLAWGRTVYPRVQIRKYFGVFTEGDLTAGIWTNALVADCIDALGVHVSPQTMTDGLQLQGIAYNPDLNRRAASIGVTGSLEPTYQRRRRRGAGS